MLTPFRRILYVDDDKDSRELIEFVIKRLSRNYEITTVGSSAEALALLNSQLFDLYIFIQQIIHSHPEYPEPKAGCA